jgi:predicted permease
MESLVQEVRFALRYLRQRPLFALVAGLSIAIGIGVNTTIFSAVNALLLRDVPGVSGPERVIEVGRTMGGRGMDTFSYPEFLDIRQQVTPIQHLSGWRLTPFSFSLGGGGERIMGMLVSHNYFDVMGLRPERGRFFRDEEDRTPGTHAVAVVSHRFWQERLGGDPGVVGSTIGLNRRSFTVIGVTPPEFRGHVVAINPDVYMPIMMAGTALPGFDAFEERYSVWLTTVGRLAPNATIEQANAALTTTFTRMREIDADYYARRSARAAPLGAVPAAGRTPVTAFLAMILGLAGVILLITCANVAGMLLARATAREKEIAIRLAIGSGRARLVRQLVIESIVLFVFGGGAGVLLSIWAGSVLSTLSLPVPIPFELDLRPDAFVLAFGLAAALGTGLLFGMVPALQATNPGLIASLKNEAARRGSRSGKLRRVFVTAQVGLSLVLLLAAGLFLRSLQRAARIETGFDATNVSMISFNLSIDGYDTDRGSAFVSTLLERVRATAGVTAASVGTNLPMDLGIDESPVYPEGFVPSGDERGLDSHFNVVSDGYFETMRIAIRRGRAFGVQDRAGAAPVAIVSRALAEQAWQGQEPIGKRLRFSAQDAPLLTVVGVAEDVKDRSLMDARAPMVYLPHAQNYRPGATLLVRSRAGMPALPESVREAIRGVDPNLSLTPLQSVEDYTALGLLPQRIGAMVTVALGLLALLLSALGVYGVIAHTVAQQTREIGVRMALGARQSDVIALVLRRGLRLALPGLLFGAAAGVALAFLIRGFVLGVAPLDPLAIAGALSALTAVVIVATLVPARKASGLEPARVLRSE